MARFLAPLAFAATVAATAALAQTAVPVHNAMVNNIKVSGAVAASANNAVAGTVGSVANPLDNFSDVHPALPVLTPPDGAPAPATKN